VGVPLIVYTLDDNVPDTPDGKLVGVALVALTVLYFISVIAEPTVTVWAVLPEAEARFMVGTLKVMTQVAEPPGAAQTAVV
jgi:hypothetical protein